MKSMFWIALLIVAIIVWLYKVKKRMEAKEYAEQQRRMKEMEKQEFDEKRRKIYASSLPQIYNQLPTDVLKEAWEIAQTILCNSAANFGSKWDLVDLLELGIFSKQREAEEELRKLVGRVNWKILCEDGRIENIDRPMFPNIDMDYIHNLLRSRGVWR